MQVHIGKDAVISEQEKERSVRECNGHSAKVVGKVGEEASESRAMYATEEVQDMMMKVNTQLTEQRAMTEVGIGSMDVVGLYPALEKGKVREILKVMILRTEVKVAQINWKEVGVYLACTHSQEEVELKGLEAVVPRWRYRPQGVETDQA